MPALDVGAGAVGAGTDDQRPCRVRVLVPGACHLLRGGRVREMPLRIPSRRDPAGAADPRRSARHDRLVRVPAQEQPAGVPTGHRHHAAFTDSELPQVEKNAWRAPTASAINCSARERYPWPDNRSSRPAEASTSDRKGSLPRTALVRSFVRTASLPMSRRGVSVSVEAVIVGKGVQQWCLRLVHALDLPQMENSGSAWWVFDETPWPATIERRRGHWAHL